MLESIVIDTEAPARLSVLWMHGLGADGNDFAPLVPYLNIPQDCPIRFVFPHAPTRAVTVNMGMRMRAWYDIINPIIGFGPEDEDGIVGSTRQVSELIQREVDLGVPTDRIVLAGFSQGGAVALHAGLRYPEPLSGILALSTYLPVPDKTEQQRHPANFGMPIVYMHGTLDPVISVDIARRSSQLLTSLDYDVSFTEHAVAHSVAPDQIGAIGEWLTHQAHRGAK